VIALLLRPPKVAQVEAAPAPEPAAEA